MIRICIKERPLVECFIDKLKQFYRIFSGFNKIFFKQIASHDLGNAWASNTINTAIFRHHGILTQNGFQYTSFYVDEWTLRIVKRTHSNETLETFDLKGEYNLNDAHNGINLGYDNLGFLHISYDHHGTQLRYRRSKQAYSVQEWTDELCMTGVYEDKVTYPSFILPNNGSSLMLLYRDGRWDKGVARIKTYNEIMQCWEDRLTPVLSGAEQSPWTSNAYWNHPVAGSDGSLHLSFVWRTHSIGKEELVNNINICYAQSFDQGLTWVTSRNLPYRLPITQVNAETIFSVSPGSNLINQTSMALDSNNNPHIVFYANDHNGVPQYQHLWLDTNQWHCKIISQRTEVFNLMGKGTLKIPISRPEIIIDSHDNVYVIYRGDLTHDQMTILKLTAPAYNFKPEKAQYISHEDLGFSEPIIDRTRWEESNILSLLIQYNNQPDHEQIKKSANRPIKLIDIKFA